MNKLTALSKLANAYWYVRDTYGYAETAQLLDYKFGCIRRSLSIEDLKPQPKNAEGMNPSGPKYL
jgi:hypothetical protein